MSLNDMMKEYGGSKENSGNRKFFRLPYIDKNMVKREGEVVFRPITDGDEVLFALFHDFVPTRPQPEGYPGKKWPAVFPLSVCGNDKNYGHGACYVCDNGIKNNFGNPIRPMPMTFFLANLRRPIFKKIGGATRAIGHESDTMEIDGTEYPALGIVNFATRTIGNALAKEYNEANTICGQDWKLTKEGEGKETRYIISPDRPDEDFFRLDEDGNVTDLWKDAYDEVLSVLQPDLVADLKKMGSKDHYDRWFNPEGEVEWTKKADNADDSSPKAEVPKPDYKEGEISADEKAALRERLMAQLK